MWLPIRWNGVLELNVRHDDNQIAHVDEMGSGAIQLNHAPATLSLNCIGFEPVAIGDIYDLDTLERQNICRLHQDGIQCDRANIVQIRACHDSAVNLSVE